MVDQIIAILFLLCWFVLGIYLQRNQTSLLDIFADGVIFSFLLTVAIFATVYAVFALLLFAIGKN